MRIPLAFFTALWIALVASCSCAIAKSPLSNSDVLLAAMKLDQALDEMVTADHNQKVKWLDEAMKRDPGSLSREEYNDRLSLIGLESAVPGVVPDEIFVRRAYLDIVGCIPSADETSAFLKDTRADKRHRLVDTLLVSPGHTRVLFTHVASLLRLRDEVLGASQAPYIAWVRKCIETNMPYDKFVQELLTSSGTLDSNPATGFFFRDQGQLFGTAAEAWRAFLDIDLTCACCHDHPFCDFTQRHFYEMAAVFSKTSIERVNAANGKQLSLWPGSNAKPAMESRLKDGETLRVRDTATGGVRFP